MEKKQDRKINMERVKQITLIACALILLGVGFINYEPSSNNSIEEVAVSEVRKH